MAKFIAAEAVPNAAAKAAAYGKSSFGKLREPPLFIKKNSSALKHPTAVNRFILAVFAFMLAITVLLSMLLQLVEGPIQKRIAKI